jgi:hypothetical protein
MIRDNIFRKHDVIYHAANEESLHSCDSVELTIKIIFDELTNDIETLQNFALISVTHCTYPASTV